MDRYTVTEKKVDDSAVRSGDGPIRFDLSTMPGDDWFTAPSIASEDLFSTKSLFPEQNKNDLFSSLNINSTHGGEIPDFTDCQTEERDHGILAVPDDTPRCTLINGTFVTEEVEDNDDDMFPTIHENRQTDRQRTNTADVVVDHVPRNSDKVRQLKEMFPDIPENQLKRCLSRAKSNLDKAVSFILTNVQNDDNSSGNTTTTTTTRKQKFKEAASASSFEVDEGGSQVKFWILMIVVANFMYFRMLFTEFKNIQPLAQKCLKRAAVSG